MIRKIVSKIIFMGLRVVVYYWLLRLSCKFNTTMPRINFSKLSHDVLAIYSYKKKQIIIDIWQINNIKEFKSVLYHEWRHHYQWSHHNAIFMWWTNHNDAYKKWYSISTIELDVYRFGNSVGSLSDDLIFKHITVKDLQTAYDERTLGELCSRLSYFVKNVDHTC